MSCQSSGHISLCVLLCNFFVLRSLQIILQEPLLLPHFCFLSGFMTPIFDFGQLKGNVYQLSGFHGSVRSFLSTDLCHSAIIYSSILSTLLCPLSLAGITIMSIMFSLECHISTLGFSFFPILFCFAPIIQKFELFFLNLVGSFSCPFKCDPQSLL